MTSRPQGRPVPTMGQGRFFIVDRLGEGGTATVYLCWDDIDQRWCALKALQPKYVDDDEMCRRFDQEAEALRTLTHPNIPRLFFHASDATPPFMVMELARCGSAMDWVRQNGPMPAPVAADIVYQICDALAEAHASGIVHRDVKPHNVLLDDTGTCKLTDFGIARVADNTSLTATGSQIGTFSFMAPEQRSDTKSVDHRADVYSVGASLYTLLTSRTSAELFVADRDDDLLVDVHPVLRDVILDATRYRAEDRYASVLLLQASLMDAMARTPSTSMGEHPPLVQTQPPLPLGAPETLADDVRLPDLEPDLPRPPPRDPDLDDTVLHTDPREGWAALPYFMPERPAHTEDPPLEVPDYVAPRDRGVVQRSARAESRSGEIPVPIPPAEVGMSRVWVWALRLTAAIFGMIGMVFAIVILIVGVGAISVTRSRGVSDAAALRLQQALEEEVSVVYQMRGDRVPFEDSYESYRTSRGAQQLAAALDFVAALDGALAQEAPMDANALPKVRRLQAVRDDYLTTRHDWEDVARTFPGSVAVRLGLVALPSRLR